MKKNENFNFQVFAKKGLNYGEELTKPIYQNVSNVNLEIYILNKKSKSIKKR